MKRRQCSQLLQIAIHDEHKIDKKSSLALYYYATCSLQFQNKSKLISCNNSIGNLQVE